jgi:hypothetical protein
MQILPVQMAAVPNAVAVVLQLLQVVMAHVLLQIMMELIVRILTELKRLYVVQIKKHII